MLFFFRIKNTFQIRIQVEANVTEWCLSCERTKTAFYFYFYLTPTQEEGKAEGDPRVLPQVRHADLSVSVTRGSLNAA